MTRLSGVVFLLSVLVCGMIANAGDGASAITRERVLQEYADAKSFKIAGKREHYTHDAASATITFPATKKEFDIAINPADKDAVRFANRATCTVTAELVQGDGVGVAIILEDEEGEQFGIGKKPLKPGANELSFAVPETLGHSWGKNKNGKPDGVLHISRLLLVRWPYAEESKVKLGSLRVTETVLPCDLVDVSFEPDEPTAVVRPGELDKAAFLLKNTHTAALELPWSLKAILPDGTEMVSEDPLTLAPGAVARIPVPTQAVSQQGVVRLEWTLGSGDETRSGTQRLGVMILAGPSTDHRDRFLFGCGGPNHRERVATIQQSIGIDVVRLSDGWHTRSSSDAEYDWTRNDEEIEMVRAHGMRVQWLLTYTPKWGAKPDTRKTGKQYWGGAPIEPEVFRDYVRELATRYKGKIDYYECRNEVDLDGYWRGTTDEYIELQKIAYKEIKAIDPDAKVMTSGFAVLIGHGGRHLNPNIMERTVKEASDYFDYVAFHQHGPFGRTFQPVVDGELARILKLAKEPKQVFYTETSVASGETWGSEEWQAGELVKKMVLARSRGAYAYEWFSFVDHREHWGLLTSNLQPKPTFCSYNAMVRALRPLEPARQLELGRERWAFVYGEPDGSVGRQAVAFWRENKKLPQADYLLPVGKGAICRAVDLYGNTKDLPVTGGMARMSPRTEPAYILMRNQTVLEKAVPLAVPEALTALEPGAELKFKMDLGNAGDEAREAMVAWILPEGLGLPEGKTSEISLKPGATETVEFSVPVPETVKLVPQTLYKAKAQYRIGSAWEGELEIPLLAALVIPNEPMEARPADLALSSDEAVVNFFGADPGNADKVWTGPEDLSAKIWLGRDGEHMLLKVDVTDDTHQQPHRGGALWQGDSIQVAFQVPGQNGNWEAGLYMPQDKALAHIFGMPKDTGLKNPWQDIVVKATKRPGGVVYEAKFPYAAFGLTDDLLAKGILFNLIVNDSDKGKREGYVRVARGIADGKFMDASPTVRFRVQ